MGTCHSKLAPKCLKRAEEHLTRECTKDRNTAAKCVNCGDEHPANSTNCKVYYLERLDWTNKSRKNSIHGKEERRRNKKGGEKKVLDLRCEEEFPHLKAPVRRTTTQDTAAAENPIVNIRQANVGTSNSRMEEISNFKTLCTEFKNLDSLVDVKQMINDIRNLNRQLAECETELGKFEVFYNFKQI